MIEVCVATGQMAPAASGAGGMGFKSRADQISHSLPTTRPTTTNQLF